MSIIFRICIADGSWDKAGTINVSGLDLPPAVNDGLDTNVSNVVFPKGTHAIRWKDPDWYWYKNFKPVVTEQIFDSESPAVKGYWDGPGNGVYPFPNYTYTGGLLVGPLEVSYFEFPLAGTFSPDMPPTELVDTLVVQVVEPGDVEFLDKSGAPVHPKLEGPGNLAFPEPPSDPCELTPEFCELTPDFKDAACAQLKLCEDQEKMEVGLVRVRDLSGAVGLHLNVVRAILGAGRSPVEQGYGRSALRKAQARMAAARRYGAAADRARNVFLEKLRARTKTPQTARFAGEVSLHVDLGLRALARCAARLDKALEGGLEGSFRDANLAYQQFDAALNQALQMKAWALAAEVSTPAPCHKEG
ncbi:MAG TPA: hypothetical protein VF173_21290 [Thermoanaerobaculia bacterium]|nr:hypothetical protein [Thermoanaerobaculia bacterium]